CLAHDMGNPPFGHSGEAAIRSFFEEGKGLRLEEKLPQAVWEDITRFDGNANTFRLLTHQFNGRRRGGFVMTYSTLAAVVKYPYSSHSATTKPKFGFFDSERDKFAQIFDELGVKRLSQEGEPLRYARHPLVYLVEAADDICYEIMDIEDAHKLRILTDEQTIQLFLNFFAPEEQKALQEAYPENTDIGDQIVYFRSCVINALERACVQVFVEHEQDILNGTFEGTLIRRLPERLNQAYRACEAVAKSRIYSSKEVADIELSGYHIIYTLLDLMTEAVQSPEKQYSRLLLRQVSSQYELNSSELSTRIMAVLDYLSGMTDVYALDLYRKINGQQLPMV
ncbi:MAG: dGTP triphosphohydrolase, partial [Alloprevotella sp.]